MLQAGPDPDPAGPTATIVRFGLFELDVRTRELRKRGVKVRLPDQAFQVLQLLAERRGGIVTREELRHRLWSTETFVNYELSLNTAVRKLREALGDSASHATFIETLPRRGYRFLVPVDRLPDARGSVPAAEPERGHLRTLRAVWLGTTFLTLGSVVLVLLGLRSRGEASGSAMAAHDRFARPAVVSPEAHDFYLKGLARSGGMSYEAFRAAASYFEQAVAKQPDFAQAHASLALTRLAFLYVGPMSPNEVLPEVEAAARRAVTLDNTLSEAHQALAVSQFVYGDHASADAAARRAFQLDPSGAAEARALLLLAEGHIEDAIDIAERARALDPGSVNTSVILARALAAAGRDQAAAGELDRALAMAPNRPTIWFQVGARHVRTGETKAGIAAFEKAIALSTQRNPRFRAYLAYAYAIDGRPLAARQILSELVALRKKQYVSSFGIALIHEGLGEKAPAFAALERAADERAFEFVHLDIYPPFTTLTSEPRFPELMQRARAGLVTGAPRVTERTR